MTKRDSTIKEAVIRQLHQDDRVAADHIAVDVRDGVVTLSGTVPTSLSLKRAVKGSWSVAGVSEVKDAMQITSSQESGEA